MDSDTHNELSIESDVLVDIAMLMIRSELPFYCIKRQPIFVGMVEGSVGRPGEEVLGIF